MRGTDGNKSEVPEEQAVPARDNKRSRENEGKKSAGNMETKLMSEQGTGFSSVV